MPNNTTNNPLTEILTYFIATILIIGGFVLLYTGKITVSDTIIFVGAGAGAVGLKFALQAPSATQQAQIATIASQQSEVISQLAAKPTPSPVVTVQVPEQAQAPQPVYAQQEQPLIQQQQAQAPFYQQPVPQQQQQPEQPQPVQLRPIPQQFMNMPSQVPSISTMPYPAVQAQ